MKILIGYCKECDSPVYNTDELIPDYKNIFQCSNCGQPHLRDELWDEVPEYIKGGK